ncbi:hypothetical protein FFF34_001520 [Inquilinus sp. KBS0705]|nr:hypothetical protein FFF34_001520 [Inquilinus sp. KBS0705]
MMTTNENTWSEDLNNQGQGSGSTSFGTPDTGDTTNRNYSDDINDESGLDEDVLNDSDNGNIPGSYSSNESMSGINSPDDDDDLATGDDIPDDDDDLVGGDDLDTEDDVDTEDDLDADYDETDLDDDTEGGGSNSAGYTSGLSGSSISGSSDPDEIPEQGQSGNEGTGYTQQNEQQQQQGGNDASYSEQNDVTPPNQHEFPSTGSPQTDFASRDQGRTTGRMIGHEPGTEGI